MSYPYSQPPYASAYPSASSKDHPQSITNRQRNTPPYPYGIPPPSSSSSSSSSSTTAYELERQNDSHIDRLHEKTAMLKHLTLTLSDEITESNKFLDNMQTTFVSTEGLLSSTQRKLKQLSQSKGSHVWCTIMGFIFFVFIIGYILKKFF